MAAGETTTTTSTGRVRREEEMLETALFSAGAALLVSCLRKIVPFLWNQSWPRVTSLLQMAPPSAFLVLILNLVIASIVIVSAQPDQAAKKISTCCGGGKRGRVRKSKKRMKVWVSGGPPAAVAAMEEKQKKQTEFVDCLAEPENGGDGDAEELNARAEAFIAAFRRQLRVDSYYSGTRRERLPEGSVKGLETTHNRK